MKATTPLYVDPFNPLIRSPNLSTLPPFLSRSFIAAAAAVPLFFHCKAPYPPYSSPLIYAGRLDFNWPGHASFQLYKLRPNISCNLLLLFFLPRQDISAALRHAECTSKIVSYSEKMANSCAAGGAAKGVRYLSDISYQIKEIGSRWIWKTIWQSKNFA